MVPTWIMIIMMTPLVSGSVRQIAEDVNVIARLVERPVQWVAKRIKRWFSDDSEE